MNASLNNAQVIFVTVPCALVFLWFAILFLEQKRQTATLQFQVISACLFTLLGFALGTDYVCLHFVREMSHSVYIADIVLLLISFCCFIIVWLDVTRDAFEMCRVQPASDLFETTGDGD